MGYMTEIGILNDQLDEIKDNPEKFVEGIVEKLLEGGTIMAQATVIPAHHADDIRVLYSGGNSFFDAYPNRNWDERRLKLHLSFLKNMRNYLDLSEIATRELLLKLHPKDKGSL